MPRSELRSVSADPRDEAAPARDDRVETGSAAAAAPATGAPVDLLAMRVAAEIDAAGGWLPFDRFMALALYTPGLGYYGRSGRADGPFGKWPEAGSDFVTAPELSPLFGRALARQVAEALSASDTRCIFEFGAGTGALAGQLLGTLQAAGRLPDRYAIVDLSGSLRRRQGERLAVWGDRVQWLDRWPEAIEGVVIGNEVLDAMPVRLLHWDGRVWSERGVRRGASAGRFDWEDRPIDRRPPAEPPGGFVPGTTVELHEQAQAFVRSLGERLTRGAAFFIDYGFPEAEYYHPQRTDGTLMCHRAHRADPDPLADVGAKDITAHVDFTGIALAAQEAGLEVLGYTSQANFLLNCGFGEDLTEADRRQRPDALRLVHEHEMGELFKVIALGRGCRFPGGAGPRGFARGDRTHRL